MKNNELSNLDLVYQYCDNNTGYVDPLVVNELKQRGLIPIVYGLPETTKEERREIVLNRMLDAERLMKKPEDVKAGDTLHIEITNTIHRDCGKVIEVKVEEVMNYNNPPYIYFKVDKSFGFTPCDHFEEFKPRIAKKIAEDKTFRIEEGLEREIRDAYCFLRKHNTTISDNTLQFMLNASLVLLAKLRNRKNLEE
jgi:hypothetical protein